MLNIEKQSVGIDIAKDSFTACICSKGANLEIHFSKVLLFENNKKGFNKFIKWFRKNSNKSTPSIFLMEATGVYYEQIANHLHKLKFNTSVILPNKVKFFAKSLNIKTKNDIVDARIIAQLAVERKVTLWEPLPPTIAKLKHLSRLNSQLQEQRTSFINMLHSKKHAFDVPKEVVKANQIIIDAITKQIEKVKKLIEKTALENEEISEKINRICQVKGLSILSVATIIAETNGFKFFENVRQLISYAGLDVREFQSGSSINRKTHISKKGNKHIRKILYFPAINVARFENTYNTFYNRINQGKKSKKIGVCAIQRKILILIYTLWKTGENYDPDFNKNRLIAISQCNDLPKDDRTAEGAFYL